MSALPALVHPAPVEVTAAPQWRPGALALVVTTALAASLSAAIVILYVTGMTVELAAFWQFGALAAGMAVLAAWCHKRGLDPRLGAAAAIVGTATVSLMLCGVVANAGLRVGLPLADGWLDAADCSVGIDASAVIHAVAERPWLTQALSFAYNTSGLGVVALILVSLVRAKIAKAWELAATAFISMQVVALASPLAPAWGAMKHFGLEGLQGHGLPVGAGVYQWPAFAHFYLGSDPVLRLSDMGGVVAFPSFHTVLALMITQGLNDTCLRWIAICWTAMIVLSAIPMGGHYAADLAAGFGVWLLAASIARRFNTPSG